MKILHNIYLILIYLILVFLVLAGCSDDFAPATDVRQDLEEGPKVEAYLSLSVSNFTISSSGTRTEEDSVTDEDLKASPEENRIDDIWVFQFDANTGEQLISPSYYEITDQAELENLKVLLKDGIPSTICVVANTRDSKWVKGDGFKTYEGLQMQTISNPSSLLPSDLIKESATNRKLIPMEGKLIGVVVAENKTIEVEVTKMFAKLKIMFEELPPNMTPYSIQINSIPFYCQIKSLGENLDEKQGAEYKKEDAYWNLKSIDATGEKREYIVYVPENLQGETTNYLSSNKGDSAPEKALVVNFTMSYEGSKLEYKFFPGGDNIKNFNIKRNSVYRIKVNILTASPDNHTPSANSFVVLPNHDLSFEPYYRTETGGGYDFKDYLDPEDPDQIIKDESGEQKTVTGDKVIAGVKIIWQTADAIGDNSNNTNSEGDKIRFIKNEEFPIHSKIYVKANKAGNALIGAYNARGEIIWSWHIWITDIDPENVGTAVEYTTYQWDNEKIYSRWQGLKDHFDATYYKRVPGYAIMKCNLGAMSDSPIPDKFATYGLLYQWGRKDPFPQMKRDYTNFYRYDEEAKVIVYDNAMKRINVDQDGSDPSKEGSLFDDDPSLFRTKLTTKIEQMSGESTIQQKGIRYSIANPTVFISAALTFSIYNYNNGEMYKNGGDWLPGHDEKLWGALEMSDDTDHLEIENDKRIWRTYGTQKSIFDPCPRGWRVPPGDLWLGLTDTGKSMHINKIPNKDQEVFLASINCVEENFNVVASNNGYTMYMEDWKTGRTCFFPTQGSRLASGQPFHGGLCGNYHNATSDINNRVNTLHFHKGPWDAQVNIFEPQLLYHVKAVAGPIRCVRDRKN